MTIFLFVLAQLIDLGGGRRVHLVCSGSGSPTVVMEAGAGEGWYTWATIQPELAKSYRVCSYDRAGIGFSDPRPGLRSIKALNDDLHTLLARAGEKPPYVLVGHSLGGSLVRAYARRWPSEVVGMVLVDSPHEDMERLFRPLPSEAAGLEAARDARRRKIAAREWEEMRFHENVPRELVQQLTPRTATEAWWTARFTETTALPDLSEPLTPDERRLDMPLVVITIASFPRVPWRTPERHAEWQKTRMQLQRELASRSPRGELIVLETSHHVHMEAPLVVIDAVKRVSAP